MGIEVTPIVCPQCSSTDVDMINETQGVCRACGTQIQLRQSFENQIVLNIGGEQPNNDSSLICREIRPSLKPEDVMRCVHASLADRSVPVDAYDAKFSKPVLMWRYYITRSITADMSYHASVGYDRQEPYVETERKWNERLKRYEENVVTKYRTVTDWSPISGQVTKDTIDTVDVTKNGGYRSLSKELFLEALYGKMERGVQSFSNGSHVDTFAGQEAQIISLDIDANRDELPNSLEGVEHVNQTSLQSKVEDSLPGDHHKDVEIHIQNVRDETVVIQKAPVYMIDIEYHGEKYTQMIMAFGNYATEPFPVSGGEAIEEDLVWQHTQKYSLLTVAALLLSCIVSIFLRVKPILIGFFVLAMAAFVFHEVMAVRNKKMVRQDVIKARLKASDRKKAEWNIHD